MTSPASPRETQRLNGYDAAQENDASEPDIVEIPVDVPLGFQAVWMEGYKEGWGDREEVE